MMRTWSIRRSPASLPGLSALVLAVVALLGIPSALAAQEGAIGGSVTALAGETLEGVQVFIPGTSFGTLTDESGRFRITGVPAGDYTLRATIIGYQGSEQPVTVTAGEVATVDFVLDVSAVALDEVVATITGERRRRELATDISTIDANNVTENTRTNRFDNVLKGQATGVFVRQSSGTVGTGSLVKIRGTGSISLSNTPLYVVDGTIIESTNEEASPFYTGANGGQTWARINDLNPDEIESVEIVKGPAASALWGARANAGVVVITTKKGTAETRWNARADLGENRIQGNFPISVYNPSYSGPSAFDTLYTWDPLKADGNHGVDGVAVPFRNGLYQNYNGNVAGGTGVFSYFGSVAYLNEKGTLPNNSAQRFNFRANLDVSPSDKVDLSFSNGYTSSNTYLPDNDNNGSGYLGNAILGRPYNLRQNLTDPVTGQQLQTCPLAVELARASAVPASEYDSRCGSILFGIPGTSFDPIATLVNLQKTERYTGSGNATWTPISRWINRFTIGYDMLANGLTFQTPVDPDLPFGSSSQGDINKPTWRSRNLTMQGTTTFLQPITQDLGFEFVGGVQWFRTTEEASRVQGLTHPAAGASVGNSVVQIADDSFNEQKSIGFFVQGQFDWKDRVFVNGAVRWDNNSASGANLGVQTYPKFGASFVAIEGADFVNQLKFRGGWGQSGKLPGTNDAKSLLAITQVAFEGSDVLGLSPFRLGNPLLEPETGEEWEAGVDMSMWQDRLGLTFTYYNQHTKNTVVRKNLPASSGFAEPQFTNIGQIDNKGFEVDLGVLALDSDNFTWDWHFIVSRNSNVISTLVDPIFVGFVGRHQQGLPFASQYSETIVIGDDGEPRILPCDETPGTWGPDDPAGAWEDFCDPSDDHRYQGKTNPTYEGSVQTTIGLFKYVQLYALVDFQQGLTQYSNTEDFQVAFAEDCACIFETGPDGELTDAAKMKRAFSFISEDPFIYDADWGKLRVVQLRFDLPPSWTRVLSLNNLSIQLIGENLVTWTSYPGTDPEVSFGGQDEVNREDFLTMPLPRRFIASINIGF
jgi:TonB-linked SusC/RagA family outer membrane protein